MSSLLFPFLNFALLVALLFVKLKAPAKGFVRERYNQVSRDLVETAAQLEKAKRAIAEYEQKLTSMQSEIQLIKYQLLNETKAIAVRVESESQVLAKEIVADARRATKDLFAQLEKEIREEVAQLVMEKAEKIITGSLTGADRERIRREFSSQLQSGVQS